MFCCFVVFFLIAYCSCKAVLELSFDGATPVDFATLMQSTSVESEGVVRRGAPFGNSYLFSRSSATPSYVKIGGTPQSGKTLTVCAWTYFSGTTTIGALNSANTSGILLIRGDDRTSGYSLRWSTNFQTPPATAQWCFTVFSNARRFVRCSSLVIVRNLFCCEISNKKNLF